MIELLVVVAIVGVLASVVLASLNTARKKARDSRRISDLHQIRNALNLYASDNGGSFPTTYGSSRDNAGDWSVAFKTALIPYLSTIPIDPLNTATYYYAYWLVSWASPCQGKLMLYSPNAEGSLRHDECGSGGGTALSYEIR